MVLMVTSMNNFHELNASLRTHGTEFVRDLVEDRAAYNLHDVNCLDRFVGQEHKRSIDVFWIQPATVLDIYYYFFNGYEDSIKI